VKTSHLALAIATLSISLTLPAGAQTTSTISGKLIDVVTYVTKDHNMGAMKSDHAMAGGDNAMAGGDHAMAGGDHAMAGGDHAMAGGDHAMAMAPASCPSLGIVSSKGRVILVSAEQGSSTAKDLCNKLNADVKLTGTAYTQGGTTVFVVSSTN
jgi:hypothetical protein